MSLRRAAIVVVIAALVSTLGTPIAEFVVLPSLIDPANVEQTIQNIQANELAYVGASFAYLAGFVGDVVVAWGLYYLLRPVSRPLAALTAGFRVVQAVVSIGAVLHLFTVVRLIHSPSFAALGSEQLHAQVLVLLLSFGYEWALALVIFGIHLVLLGYLVYRSRYMPRLVGVALLIAGAGYIVYELGPYLYPAAQLDFLFVTFAGEALFLLWLAVRGWRIPEGSVVSPVG